MLSFNVHPVVNSQSGAANHVDVFPIDTPVQSVVLKDHKFRVEMKCNGSSRNDD